MLGLRPRLKARNSLWDLVSKVHLDQLPPPVPVRDLFVEDAVARLPPLPTSPSSTSPSFIDTTEAPRTPPALFSMAPVRIRSYERPSAVVMLTRPFLITEGCRQKTHGGWRRTVWCVASGHGMPSYKSSRALLTLVSRVDFLHIRVRYILLPDL